MEAKEATQSRDADTRRLAVMNAIELDEPEAIAVILEGFEDTDGVVRAEAARAIAEIPGPHMLPPLLKLLYDEDDLVRKAAAETLAECNEEGLQDLYKDYISSDQAFVRAAVLRAVRPLRIAGVAPYALSGLSDESMQVRIESSGVLGYLQDPAYLQNLASAALTDPSHEVRRTAMGALGYRSTVETVGALVRGLKDTAWQVREEAAATIAKLKAIDAGPALVGALGTETYWQVMAKILTALGRIRYKEGMGAAAEMLSYSVSNVRKEAALCLGEIGDARALPSLREALKDRDPDVKKLASWAIAKIEMA